jgi:hypothetical protein
LKARDNPFNSERILKIRYRLWDLSWGQLMQRLAEMKYRGALVGPEGSGKTTLLEDLEPAMAALGFTIKWLRLNQTTHSFLPGLLQEFYGNLARRDIIFFDGAEQLNWLAWQRFTRNARRAGGLLITTHQNGRLPTLIECRTSANLFEEIVRDLTGEDETEIRPLARGLFQKHQGNLRTALRELYDYCAAVS